MIRDLVKSNDSILHRKIEPCGCDCDRRYVAKILIENMLHYEGVGLSANQIGMDTRAFAMIKNIEYNDIIVCFNPKIVKQYSKTCVMEEGCLSYPDEFLEVERSESIVVKYEDEDRKNHKVKLKGFAARVFLHEFDHLQGITFKERT